MTDEIRTGTRFVRRLRTLTIPTLRTVGENLVWKTMGTVSGGLTGALVGATSLFLAGVDPQADVSQLVMYTSIAFGAGYGVARSGVHIDQSTLERTSYAVWPVSEHHYSLSEDRV
ncbi:MAG: hypothetical protein ABIH82_03810 [Candidatus Woesearchaeota archaeon]